MAQKGSIRIGTSGWMYKDWGKRFYPPELKKGHLAFLATEFDTVEINSSFYHLPLESTFKKWRGEVPADFVYAVKMSRFVTHILRLKDAYEPLYAFLSHARALKEKLGVILIQLPPSLKYDAKLLDSFLKDLKKASSKARVKPRFAIEPRHISWMDNANDVRARLKKHGSCCIVFPHSKKIPSFAPEDENVIADFAYVRFHGPSEFAASSYGARRLKPWAERIKMWREKGIDVFVYFNNDINGHAIDDARILKKQVGA